jgi:hypothetical protein
MTHCIGIGHHGSMCLHRHSSHGEKTKAATDVASRWLTASQTTIPMRLQSLYESPLPSGHAQYRGMQSPGDDQYHSSSPATIPGCTCAQQ